MSDEYYDDEPIVLGADLINMDYDDAYNSITCFKRDDMVVDKIDTISTKYITNDTIIWDTKELGYNIANEILYVKREGVEDTKPDWIPDVIVEA